jgi:cell surface protein SprA
MQEQTNQPTAGLKITTIKFATDYAVNERLNIRAFYDMTINKPVVSTSFPTANTQVGITIRFTLAQ